MTEFPETVDSLIVRIRDPSNSAAWDQFEQLYRPVIYRIAGTKGLQHADALDLVQQVLLSVASAIDRFEKQDHGVRFRNWLNFEGGTTEIDDLRKAEDAEATAEAEVQKVEVLLTYLKNYGTSDTKPGENLPDTQDSSDARSRPASH